MIGNRPKPNEKRRKKKKGGRVIDFLAILIGIDVSTAVPVSYSSFFAIHTCYPLILFVFLLLTRTLDYIHAFIVNDTPFFFVFCVHNFGDGDSDGTIDWIYTIIIGVQLQSKCYCWRQKPCL
jgi:hypothetical protein